MFWKVANSFTFIFGSRWEKNGLKQQVWEMRVIADCQEKLSKLPPLFADNKGIFRVIFLSNLARENYCMKKKTWGFGSNWGNKSLFSRANLWSFPLEIVEKTREIIMSVISSFKQSMRTVYIVTVSNSSFLICERKLGMQFDHHHQVLPSIL